MTVYYGICRDIRVSGYQMYTVVGTLCRQSSTEIEFGQSGWLARSRGSEKLHWKSHLEPVKMLNVGI
jgi:hypothetical protein